MSIGKRSTSAKMCVWGGAAALLPLPSPPGFYGPEKQNKLSKQNELSTYSEYNINNVLLLSRLYVIRNNFKIISNYHIGKEIICSISLRYCKNGRLKFKYAYY